MGVFQCSEGVRQSVDIVLQEEEILCFIVTSGVFEAGMPIHSVALYSYGQVAFEQ